MSLALMFKWGHVDTIFSAHYLGFHNFREWIFNHSFYFLERKRKSYLRKKAIKTCKYFSPNL